MSDNNGNIELRQYVKYINIISSVLLIVSLICIIDLCLCTYEYNNIPSYKNEKYETQKNNTADSEINKQKNEVLEKSNILLTVIITLGLSMASLVVSSILLFLFAMQIIHVTEISRLPLLSSNYNNTGNRTTLPNVYEINRDQRQIPKTEEILPVYDEVNEEPTFPSNHRNISSSTNNKKLPNIRVYDNRNQRQIPKTDEMLPVYDEVHEEPSFISNRHNMSPPISTNRKQTQEEQPDYDDVRVPHATSNSRKPFLPGNEEEDLPEYDEPIIPQGKTNSSNISQKPRFYERLRENTEELVDYDEVRIVGEEINTGSRNIAQHSRIYEKLRKDTEELVDDENTANEINKDSTNMRMQHINEINHKQSAENITESFSQNDKITYSDSLEDLLQSFNIPESNKQETNTKTSSNEIKMKNINDQLYQKDVTQESTRNINYRVKTNTTSSFAHTGGSSSINTDLSKTMYEKQATRTTKTNQEPSNIRKIETATNNGAEDNDYDYIKN